MGITTTVIAAVFLILNDLGERGQVIGSGFGVSVETGEHFLVTNQHVARKATENWTTHLNVKIFLTQERDKGSEPSQLAGLLIPAELVAVTDRGQVPQPGWDIAVVPLWGWIQRENRTVQAEQVFIRWEERIEKQEIKARKWWEGSRAVTIGYPKGIGWKNDLGKPAWPTVRSGVVARMQNWLNGENDEFMLDIATLGGQSGGPVFLDGRGVGGKLRLAGMTYGHVVERDTDGDHTDGHLQGVVPVENIRGMMLKARELGRKWLSEQKGTSTEQAGARQNQAAEAVLK